jgi:hypothetical protein
MFPMKPPSLMDVMKDGGEKIFAERMVTVSPDLAANHFGSGTVEVYATPAMISLMESAALAAIAPHLEEGQTSEKTVKCDSLDFLAESRVSLCSINPASTPLIVYRCLAANTARAPTHSCCFHRPAGGRYPGRAGACRQLMSCLQQRF